MSELQRYRIASDGGIGTMEYKERDGDWLKADEAEAALAEKDDYIATVKVQLGLVNQFLSIHWSEHTPKMDSPTPLTDELESILSTVQKPLAVVKVPDGSVAMVIASDPGEKMVVLTDAISGATVVVVPQAAGDV